MDPAAAGVICGLVGALVGAGAAYFGPLAVERRRQHSEQSIRAEEQDRIHLDRYVQARATVDIWIDLLQRAYDDVTYARLDLAGFEAEATRHSEQLRSQLAELIHLGVPTTGDGEASFATGSMFSHLRWATREIKHVELLPPEEKSHRVSNINRRIEGCREVRNDWSLTVLATVSRRSGTPWRGGIEDGLFDGQPLFP